MNISSAYETIKANIGADGRLPQGFSLKKEDTPNQISFAPGAEDGIFPAGSADKQTIQRLVALLKEYFRASSPQCLSEIDAILKEHRAISLIDPVLESIQKDHEGVDPNRLANLSFYLAKTSSNEELIKIALGLLGMFDLSHIPEVCEVIFTLGLYEEFTLFSAAAVLGWANGNQMIFRLAKSVSGWGKIQAVECLEPETEEIREWILHNGCANDIMNAYLGLACAVKGDLISVLRRDFIDAETFECAGVIIDALLDEGPALGISGYKHAQEALLRYLGHAKQHACSIEHLCRILDLQRWAENAEIDGKEEIHAGCDEIIGKRRWAEQIVDAVKQQEKGFELFCACRAADYLGIDVSVLLFEKIQRDPIGYCSYIPRLMKKPDMALQMIELYEAVLPLEDMAEGMGDYFFADKLKQEYQCLEFVLQELAKYPLRGVRLVKTGLNSRVIRERNMAICVLSGWSESEGRPLADLSPELYAEVARIYQVEVNEKTKEAMKKLLG